MQKSGINYIFGKKNVLEYCQVASHNMSSSGDDVK